MKKIILLIALIAASSTSYAQQKAVIKKPTTKFGALAIDRSNGFYYGWSYDYPSLAEAEKKAVEECKAKGGNCTVVLSYAGSGCAAYRSIDGNTGSAFGWGVAKTKEAADEIATKECLKRSNGKNPSNFVWSCNSVNTGSLKEIYNASEEIEAPVKVGNQIWSNRNFDASTFRNGDEIPEAKNAAEWKEYCTSNKPAFVYLNFDPKNGKKYGKLYNLHAVVDSRGLAPEGWHVPSKSEFETLIAFLGGKREAGKKIKGISAAWNVPDKKYGDYCGNGTNSSGLNFLPGGKAWENTYDKDVTASYVFPGHYGDGAWWTSTIDGPDRWNPNSGYGYYNNGFSFGFSSYKNNFTSTGSDSPQRGFSVRLIKD